MATSVGSLTVLLGLDAAEYTRGLTKAEAQAKRFAQNTRAAIAQVATVIGSLGIGAIILENTKAIIAEAAALDDLADATGSSVEALSQLNNQAKISGTDLATLQSALLKLSQGMAGADDESKAASEALKVLGVTSKDPAQAMQQVALSLAKYEDGVNKVAIAVALFGKQGAALLPLLKDMAESQDVQATVTAKQAQEADKLEKQWRALTTRATEFSTAILNDLVPALNRLLSMTAQAGLPGVFAALGLTSEDEANAFRSLDETQKKLASLRKAREELDPNKGLTNKLNDIMFGDVGDIDKQIKVMEAREARLRAMVNAQFVPREAEKPEAPKLTGGGTAKAAKADRDEVDALIKSLEKQLQSTLDLNDVDLARIAIYNIEAKGIQKLSDEQRALIEDMAEQIKFSKEQEKAAKEFQKLQDDAARDRDRINAMIDRSVESAKREKEAIEQGNEQMREQLIVLRGGQGALDAYTAAKNEKLAAELEDRAATAEAAAGLTDYANELRAQAALLRERNRLITDTKVAESIRDQAKALQDVKNMFADSFANAFTDFISGTKSAKDAFKAFADDMLRQLNRIAAQQVANLIFGGNTGGNGGMIMNLIGTAVGAFFGGGTGGVPGVGFSGGGFGEHFAMGGVSTGGTALVGEQGPELVNLPAGSRVTPANQTRELMRPMNVVQQFTINGPSNRQTEHQVGLAAARGLSSALRNK